MTFWLGRRFRHFHWRIILRVIGWGLVLEAGLLLLPMVTAFFYREWTDLKAFLFGAILAALIGAVFAKVGEKEESYFARDGMAAVGLCWVAISMLGAVPFVFSGQIPSYVDAFFETVSGFTTTGATILTDVESMSRSILFWRSFTHWIGGMGVLVFVLAILPKNDERSMFIMRAEAPGPTISKLVPRMRQSAAILYWIYVGLSVLELVFLLAGGLSFFDALVHTFGTAGTGGFGIYSDSVAAFHSTYVEMVITVFMFLFGVNFNLYFFLLIKDFKAVRQDVELKVYFGIVAVSTLLIALNLLGTYAAFGECLRPAVFQVVSVITTTGYATADFNLWPMFSKMILFFLMVCGAMAGSTGGGVKVIRIMVVLKKLRRNLSKLVHPNKVETVTFHGEAVSKDSVDQTVLFFALWFVIIAVCTVIVAMDNFDFETTISSVYTCIGNVGPGFGKCGPAGTFAEFSILSKLTLSFAMLTGRLEIYPMLILFFPLLRQVKFKKKGKKEKEVSPY